MTTATDVGFVEMRIAKVVGVGGAEDEVVRCVVVLDEVTGDRRLPIMIGQAEAFSLAARLGGIEWPRPMTYQFTAALIRALGAGVSGRRGSIGSWRRPTPPPWSWKARMACSRWMRGRATHSTWRC
jgi:hypothetical protein